MILAGGVRDRLAPVAGAEALLRAGGGLRQCPICDGYEVRGKRVAVIGHLACTANEALFLRGYTADLTVVTLGRPFEADAAQRRAPARWGIALAGGAVCGIGASPGAGIEVRFAGRAGARFEVASCALGGEPRLPEVAGLALSPDGRVITDARQETNVAGVFAAGDVVTGLDQIGVALAQGEVAAVAIRNRLRRDGGLAVV